MSQLMALRTKTVKDNFGVMNFVTRHHSERPDEAGRNFGIAQAFHLTARLAHKVRVLMSRLLFTVAQRVSPGAIFTSDAMDEFLASKSVEGAVNRDSVSMAGKFGKDVGNIERLFAFTEDIQHAQPYGGRPQPCLIQGGHRLCSAVFHRVNCIDFRLHSLTHRHPPDPQPCNSTALASQLHKSYYVLSSDARAEHPPDCARL